MSEQKRIKPASLSLSPKAREYLAYLKDKKFVCVSRFVSELIEKAAAADFSFVEGEK